MKTLIKAVLISTVLMTSANAKAETDLVDDIKQSISEVAEQAFEQLMQSQKQALHEATEELFDMSSLELDFEADAPAQPQKVEETGEQGESHGA